MGDLARDVAAGAASARGGRSTGGSVSRAAKGLPQAPFGGGRSSAVDAAKRSVGQLGHAKLSPVHGDIFDRAVNTAADIARAQTILPGAAAHLATKIPGVAAKAPGAVEKFLGTTFPKASRSAADAAGGFLTQHYPHATTGDLGKLGQPRGGVMGMMTATASPIRPEAGVNTLKDVINLPAEFLPSSYLTGKAVADAILNGDTKGLKEQGEAIARMVTHPSEHPLDLALMAKGGAAGLTRGLEGAARKGAFGPGLKQTAIAKLADRPDRPLYGNLVEPQAATAKNPVTRLEQRAQARVKDSGPTMGVDPLERAINRRVDEEFDRNIVGHKAARTAALMQRAAAVLAPLSMRGITDALRRVGKDSNASVKPHIPGHEAVSLITQGLVRSPLTVAQDLQHLHNLASNFTHEPGSAQAEASAAFLKHVEKLQKDKAFLANPGPAFKSAAQYAQDTKPLARRAAQLGYTSREAVNRAPLIPYARVHMGAGHDPEVGLHVNGKPLSNGEIHAHMRANGIDPANIGFVTHQLEQASNPYYQPLTQRPIGARAGRTGEAAVQGTHNPSHEALVDQHAKLITVIHQHESMNRLLHQFSVDAHTGAKNPEGSPYFQSYAHAQAVARDPAWRAQAGIPDRLQVVPIRIAGQYAKKGELAQIKRSMLAPDEVFHPGYEHATMSDLGQHLTGEAAHAPGQFALIPKIALDRFRAHEARSGQWGSLARGLVTQFKRTALPFSPKWMLGVPQEVALRAIASGSGPSSLIAAHRYINRLSSTDFQKQTPGAKAYLDGLTARALQGTQFAHVGRMATRTNTDRYPWGVRLIPQGLAKARGTPGVGHLMRLMRGYQDGVMKWQKQQVEARGQKAYLGRLILNDFERTQGVSWAKTVRLQGGALDDLIRGHIGSNKQIAFAREIDRMGGKFSKLAPSARTALLAAPFGLWWVNSLRFIYATLPHHHPIITGLQAAANAGSEPARQRAGLDLFAPGRVASFEQGGIPAGGKVIAQQYYSPAGAVNDPIKTGMDMLGPYLQTPMQGALGVNFKGDKLKPQPEDIGDRFELAANSLLDTFLPGERLAKAIGEQAGKPLDDSTVYAPHVKPGTAQDEAAGLLKYMKPFRSYNAVPEQGHGRRAASALDSALGGGSSALGGASGGGRSALDSILSGGGGG